MKLLKFVSAWDHASEVPKGVKFGGQIRVNRYNPSIVYFESNDVRLDQVSSLFAHTQNILQARCTTLKFTFDGEPPAKDLQGYGFKRHNDSIWRKGDLPYDVAAIPLVTLNRWVLQVMKRKGKGVTHDACELPILFRDQPTQLMLGPEGEVTAS